MTLAELKDWLSFIELAPEPIRPYLGGLIWTLAALLLIWGILKLIFNDQFTKLYALLEKSARFAGEAGKAIVKSTAKSLELPEPYPRVAKFFAIVVMLNSYAASLVFLFVSLSVAILTVMAKTPAFWGRTAAALFVVIFFYFAWFFFADAERDRVRLFKPNFKGDKSKSEEAEPNVEKEESKSEEEH